MSYDPIQRAIDIQLSGILNDYRPSNPEDLIIRAIDLKYHAVDRRSDIVIAMSLQGYTQIDIGNLMGYSQQMISIILRNY